jgi:hypothetical protein
MGEISAANQIQGRQSLIKEIDLRHPRVFAQSIHEFKLLDAHSKYKFENLQIEFFHQEET